MKNKVKIFGIIFLAAIIGVAVPVSAQTRGETARLIDEYEKFVSEYIEVVQKMMAGDMTVVAQAQALETRAHEMANRFDNLSEADLTPEQLQKYLELTHKITSTFGF